MATQGHSRVWNGYAVSCYNVDEKRLGNYILGQNNFGLKYELSIDQPQETTRGVQ